MTAPKMTEEDAGEYLGELEEIAISLLLLARTPLAFNEKGLLTEEAHGEHLQELSEMVAQLASLGFLFQHGAEGPAVLDRVRKVLTDNAKAIATPATPATPAPKLTLVPE